MLKLLRFMTFIVLVIEGCKTVRPVADQTSHTSDIRTGYYTLKSEIKIADTLQKALNDATGQEVCFGELYNDANVPTVGVYLCAFAPNDLRPGTGIFFESTGGKILYYGAMVGDITSDGGQRSLLSLCNGSYNKLCRIWYEPDSGGIKFEFTGTFDVNQWQFQVTKTLSPRESVASYLRQIDGHQVCLGELKHDIGSGYGIFLCDQGTPTTLNANQVVMLDIIGTPSPIHKIKVGRNGVAYGEIGPVPESKTFYNPTFKTFQAMDPLSFAGLASYTPGQLDIICRAGLGQQTWDRTTTVRYNQNSGYHDMFLPRSSDGGLDHQYLRNTPSIREITCVPYHNDTISFSDFCQDKSQWPCAVHVKDGKLVIEEVR